MRTNIWKRRSALFAFLLAALAKTALSQPDQPLGLKGMLTWGGQVFTLLWEPVQSTSDGRPAAVAGYNVYRRNALNEPGVKINSYLLPDPLFADRVDGKIFYYSVRAVDADGRESDDSPLAGASLQTQIVFLAEDGRTHVSIPGAAAEYLRSSRNKYGVPLLVKLLDEDRFDEKDVLRDVRLKIVRGDNKEEVTDLSFPVSVEVNIAYDAPPASQAAPLSSPDAARGQISVFWNNGVEWIKLGGVLNENNQTIAVRSAQPGRYQLRLSAPAAALTLKKSNVFPSLFTPNGDGLNDRVFIVLENPNNAALHGKIFDVTGRFVSDIPVSAQTNGVGTTLAWAGQDSNGSVVPSGLYIYRIEGDGRLFTGTVAVAR